MVSGLKMDLHQIIEGCLSVFYPMLVGRMGRNAEQGPKRASLKGNHGVDLGALFLQLRYNALINNLLEKVAVVTNRRLARVRS